MPKLRFKNNLGCLYEIPDEVVLADVFDTVKATNKDGKNKNVITNSAEYGLIPQRDFFDKDIAVEGNTEKYTIIEKGDFVYNPRKSTTAPYGPFNCYNREEPGIVSPLYSCLKPKDHSLTPYLLHYFSSPAWYSYIYHNGNQGGARHDRVGMTDDLLMGIPVLLPCSEEREKISEFLSLYDEKISIQKRKVEALENRKKGFLQQIFSQEIRFKADDGSEFDDWETEELNNYLYENKERNKANFYGKKDVLSVSKDFGVVNQIKYQGKSLAGEDVSNYHIVYEGNIVYTKSPLGKQPYGIIKASTMTGIVSTLYAVYHCKNNIIPQLLDYYFSLDDTLNCYLKPLVNIGAKHDMKVNNEDAIAGLVTLPTSLEEQKKIVSFFQKIDEQIRVEKDKLEAIKKVKKGLLQQMFV